MTIDLLTNPGSIVTPINPILYFHPMLSIPLQEQNNDVYGTYTILMLMFRLNVNLNEVFSPSIYNKKSLQEDQLGIFAQIESNIDRLGMRGHDCVLRFICELNSNKFAQSSIIGQILRQMFTPAASPDSMSKMDDYFEADLAGQKGTNVTEVCASMYSSCGMSVFAALEKFQSQWGIPKAAPTQTSEPDIDDVMNDINIQEENYDVDDVNTHEDKLQSLNGL